MPSLALHSFLRQFCFDQQTIFGMENKQPAEIEGSICDLEHMNLADFALDDFVAKENNEESEIEKIKVNLFIVKFNLPIRPIWRK